MVADDSGGSSSIYEFTRSGELVSSTNLVELTGSEQFADPEGLAIDPATGTLYAVFDDDDPDPNRQGDSIASFQLSHAPELGNIDKFGSEDTQLNFAASDFTATFSDLDGDNLSSITIASIPANGTLTLSGEEVTEGQVISATELDNLVYTPNGDLFWGRLLDGNSL